MCLDVKRPTRKRASRIALRSRVKLILVAAVSLNLLWMSRMSSLPPPLPSAIPGSLNLHDTSAPPSTHPFTSCLPLPDSRWFDVSLTQRAPSAEVRARPTFRQPRDAPLIWDTIRAGVWHGPAGPIPLSGVQDTDAHMLHAAVAAAKSSIHRDAGAAARVSVASVAARTSVHGVQFAVTTRVRRRGKAFLRVATLSAPPGGRCTLALTRLRTAKTVHVVMPYAERTRLLRAAVARMVALARRGANLRLLIAARAEDVSFASRVAARANLHAPALVRVVTVGGGLHGRFSRAVALRDAMATLPGSALAFFADVDMAVAPAFLDACRAGTVRGSQAFFPVVFSLYPYGRRVRKGDGYWRESGYGMACMFRQDFDAVGGFAGGEEGRYAGWGGEDIDLYNRFREHTGYAVLRAREPALVHVWHQKQCEHNGNFAACMRTVFLTSASAQRLAEVFAKSGMSISQLMKA